MTKNTGYMDQYLARLHLDSKTMATHVMGVPMETLRLVRDGENRECVDCSAEPLAGGLRCYPCFRLLSRQPRLNSNPAPSLGRVPTLWRA